MISIFIGALILSIWCVILFFGKNIGLSMLLFVVPFIYYVIHILEKNNKIENSKAKILIIPITLLASTYFLFNNSFFNKINIIVIPILIIIMILRLFKETFEMNLNSINKIIDLFFTPISFIGETFENLRNSFEDKLKINIDSRKEQNAKKIIKSILITLPIVLIIIILLSSADEIFGDIFINIFERIITSFTEIEIITIIKKIILIICLSIYFLCFFCYIVSKHERNTIEEKTSKINDNFTIKMMLTMLNIIYLVFCYIQIKSLFMRKVEFNYARYARQGFIQLMIVSVINLVTIIIAKKNENADCKKENKYINTMCLLMIVFTFIILLSSAVRMHFYESAYGYTTLRLLVYIILVTETILLVPTLMYINDKNINLIKTYFTIILLVYVLTNLVNTNNIITARNVNRYFEIGKIDIDYLKKEIGIDCIPKILEILETEEDFTNKELHEEINQYIDTKITALEQEKMDYRDVNISKMFIKNLCKTK